MNREQFHQRVNQLREEGNSIRGIALELNVHRSRVERALKALERRTAAEARAFDVSQSFGSPARGLFVGRQREMAELKTALGGALSGQGRLVMLVGEPGIGKTRTSEELASAARQMGAQVLWGSCPEERGAPTYWPWVQAIGSYVLTQEPDILRSQMGIGAVDIASIVPDVQERLPDLIPSVLLEDPEQARFRFFGSFTSFLKRASQDSPLLLVLDNLHWADSTSLRLLEFVTPELTASRVLLLGTYRDADVYRGHPLFYTLGELTREHLYQRVLLRGLSRNEVGQVMGAVGGVALPQELITKVHQQTEGNPLFVREVMRLLAEEGLLASERLNDLQRWDFRLPEGILEVIGRRLDRLSKHCNEVLMIASVIGRQFSLRLLAEITQEPQEELLEVLEEALTARIIEEIPSMAGHYQFSRAMIRQTLATELSTTRKVRLHARIAQALEEIYGADAPEHAAELAYHLAEAEAVTGAAKLIHYSRLAGERALTAYAYEEALAHFQRALAAKRGDLSSKNVMPNIVSEGATDAQTADLMFGLGRAEAATYRINDAMVNLGHAFEYYVSAGDTDRVVALVGHPYPGSLSLLMPELHRRALSLVESESKDAGRLLAGYGLSVGRTADYQGAKQALSQAHTIARRKKDVKLEVGTLANIAQVEGFHLRWQECLDNSLQAIDLSRQVDDLAATLRAHYCAGKALLQFGKAEEARQHAEAMLALTEEFPEQIWLTRALLFAHQLSHLTGDFQAARKFGDRAVVMDPSYVSFLAWRVQLEYQVGNYSQGSHYLNELMRVLRLVRPGPLEDGHIDAVIPIVAQITGIPEQLDLAEQTAYGVLSMPSVTPDRIQCARAGLALLAVGRGDVAAAAEQYDHLRVPQGQMTKAGGIMVNRILGLLAQTLSQLDLAEHHFKDALAFSRKAGYRPELSWTCYNYATFLNQRRQQKRALALANEGLSVSAALGMRPLSEKLSTLRESIDVQLLYGEKYPANLTERQVQVLRLIAEGKTNREIADELVLSERTVHRHIAEIYAKIGARNRAEATVFSLNQLDLIE